MFGADQAVARPASSTPLIVVWRVHEECPLACAFCGYSRTVARTRRSVAAEDVLRFGRTLADYGRAAGREVLVSWLGGEPLLWPHLAEVSRALRDEGLRLGVTTNGLLLASPETRRLLIETHEQATISIDGLAAFHDRVRGQPGLFARLQAIVAAFRQEAPGCVLLRVNTVLMRGNIGGFAEFCEEMAEWGFDELTFNQLGGNDRPEFYPANRLLPEQVERFCAELPDIRGAMSARGLRIAGSDQYLERIRRTTNGERLPIADCRPGEAFLFIDEQGRVSPCSFTSAEYGVPLGELDSVAAMEQLGGRFRSARRIACAAACGDCHATHVFEKFAK